MTGILKHEPLLDGRDAANLGYVNSVDEAYKLIAEFETGLTTKFSCFKADKGFGNTGMYIYIYIYFTNRFQVAVCLFSNRSQMTSKCGKNKKVAHEAQPSVSLMFLPHFDVLCNLLLNRRTATWNLFVLYNKELKKVLMMMSFICLSSNRS